MAKTIFNARRLSAWFAKAQPYLMYAALLAFATLALTWLDYFRFTRSFPGEVQMLLIASGFLGLGVWAGARLF